MTASPHPDAVLVAQCREGDSGAWEALVARHGPLVWAVARRAGLSAEDAADVFQNTWCVALEELSRLRDASRLASWLARVARHQAMRVRRGYGIARRARDTLAREDLDVLLPDEELAALEERRRVSDALARIGRRCAELLRALYYEEPTPDYREIAMRFGMAVGSIGPTRGRCLERLEKELADE